MAQEITTCDASKSVQYEQVVGSGWKQLTAGQDPSIQSCLRVRIMAPRAGNTKAGTNTGDIYVYAGSPTVQPNPSKPDGGEPIASDGSRDNWFHVTDPRTLWLHGSNGGDAVEVRIEFQS